MGIERNTWLARTSEVKNKLDNEQELTTCSQPRRLLKKFVWVLLESEALALEGPSGR